MNVKQKNNKLHLDLVEWSNNKESYSIDDFLKERGITKQQMSAMALGKNSFYISFGKAMCQCLDNAYKAWKSNEISKDHFSKYLAQSQLFGGCVDAEMFDQMRQKFDLANN